MGPGGTAGMDSVSSTASSVSSTASSGTTKGGSNPTDAAGSPESSGVRFELAGELRDRSLHGSWWPRSRDGGEEIGALVPELVASLGTISRVALSSNSWTNRTRRTTSPRGRTARIGWFSVVDPNVLTVVRPTGPRLRLLIVPPEASAESASNAGSAAVAQGRTESPADLLVTAGVSDVHRVRPGDLGMYGGSEQ